MILYLAAAATLTPALQADSALHTFLHENFLEVLTLFPTLGQLVLLALIVRINRYIRDDQKKIMMVIVAVVFTLVLQNDLEYHLAAGELRRLARTLVSIYGYAVRPVILLLFLKVLAPQRRFRPAWALVGVNAAVNATALFSHICFWIDAENHYQSGPLGNLCLYVSVILLACWFVLTIRVFEPQKRKETWIPLLVLLLILVSISLDYHVGLIEQPVSFLTLAIVIGCVAYTVWLLMQYMREHEQAMMAEQRIQIMMTQIQPHFLYNTLASIRALCRIDPEKAGKITEQLSDYLRQNLDSLSIVGLIPFSKELEHTRTYAEIEMLRFENLRVEYDIQDDHFSLPPLTVQPLVENAIRHGVRIREQGRVKVAACCTDSGFEVTVQDNGIGFDTETINTADATHIGIRNVRERIERMCGGTLAVDSRVGEGTSVTITIPVRKDSEEESA